jgi:hypothetical protein
MTGEEPCLRKVQLSRQYSLPKDAKTIQYEMKHKLLISKVISDLQVISELSGEIFVDERAEKDFGDITSLP